MKAFYRTHSPIQFAGFVIAALVTVVYFIVLIASFIATIYIAASKLIEIYG